MINIKNIIPECDADTLLVELVTQLGRAMHQNGNTNVSIQLKRMEDKFLCIGIVDSDKFKNTPEYLLSFTEIVCDKINEPEKLILKRLPHSLKHLIYIHPAFEKWIWNQAELAGLHTPDSIYYNDFESFKRDAKKYGIERSQKLKKFVNSIVQANPAGIILLRKWLLDNNFE